MTRPTTGPSSRIATVIGASPPKTAANGRPNSVAKTGAKTPMVE